MPEHVGSKTPVEDVIIVDVPDSKSRDGSSWRNGFSFFVFGIVNNMIYVMFMSSAVDIMRGSSLPKSTVLLVNIFPSMIVKLICPCIMHMFSYRIRVWATTATCISALLATGLGEPIWVKLIGVAISSAGSGFGESSFLSLLSFYHIDEVSCWASGTGASGIIAAMLYLALTTFAHLSLMHACMVFCIFPVLMLLCYEFVLIKHVPVTSTQDKETLQLTRKEKIYVVKSILFPYLLPLLLVYFSEYLILGTVFVLVFPVGMTPFESIESEFRFYNLCVQVGVFMSRSSLFLFRIRNTWIPAILQVANLVAFMSNYLDRFVHSYMLTCFAVLWVGTLGGFTYANTYANILSHSGMEAEHVEFAMAIVGISDSVGIVMACIISVFLEPALCQHDYYCKSYQ